MKDFTYKTHQALIESLQKAGYSFITFLEYLENSGSPSLKSLPPQIILRHDVEQRYESALRFAQIQHSLGIKGSYYFRILPKCFRPKIVEQIAALGHEIGYHYDDLAVCKGDYTKAMARFEKNLNILRNIAPVATICMDGSPLSKYDNRDLWSHPSLPSLRSQKSFHDFGLKGEPYFNMDFNDFFYLTDTGRRWDGWKTSVRDKVPQQEDWAKQGLVFRSTQDIIKAVENGRALSGVEMPDHVMFTMHPQRWTDSQWPWLKELVLQNLKNVVKFFLVEDGTGGTEGLRS